MMKFIYSLKAKNLKIYKSFKYNFNFCNYYLNKLIFYNKILFNSKNIYQKLFLSYVSIKIFFNCFICLYILFY